MTARFTDARFTDERTEMPRFLDAEELDLLAIGVRILGTGGGGSHYASHLVVQQFYADGGCIALLDPDKLADDDVVAVISTTLVFKERMTDAALAL